jgi:hypothetical protein
MKLHHPRCKFLAKGAGELCGIVWVSHIEGYLCGVCA